MKTTGIFTPYTPTNPKQLEAAAAIKAFSDQDVIFLQSPEGDDWYAAQEAFSPDSMKIQFDADGIIRMFSRKASALNPVNCAVAEVAPDDVPDGLNVRGEWAYYDGTIQPRIYTREEQAQAARLKIESLLDEADDTIRYLERAIRNNMATEEEKLRLEAWEKYSVLVNRVNPEKPEWPVKPE